MNTHEIFERLGDQANEKTVRESFDGMSVEEIYNEIHTMFPEEGKDGNMELAEAVYEFCNK